MRNTGFKSRTLDPIWNESFAVKLSASTITEFQDSDEILHVDVWNFLPDEKIGDKLRTIIDVKDSKGLRQYIMDAVGGNGSNSGPGTNATKLFFLN